VSRIVLVRHGEASASWGDAAGRHDPGLSPLGRRQAEAAADVLLARWPDPVQLVSSPMRRCVETAAPLAQRWEVTVRIEPRVGEIPSPAGLSVEQRSAWLTRTMSGGRHQLTAELRQWNDGIEAALSELDGDAVVFSHFVAINVALGWATGVDDLVVARLANCSITTLERDGGGGLRLVEAGREADSEIR
jgi:broad specificity phosphatase PhoE